MDNWQGTLFGLRQLPRELTAFEIEAFFTFTLAERQVIEERRRPELKLGLALQIGFFAHEWLTARFRTVVPSVLWRHLGEQFEVEALIWLRFAPCTGAGRRTLNISNWLLKYLISTG
jgi:hypothetical protein